MEEEIVKTNNGEFSKYSEYKYYENGTYTCTIWDDCFNHKYRYVNLALNEVYHQMLSDYCELFIAIDRSELYIPVFQEKTENILKFECYGASQDLQIELIDNQIFEVSSYDCT